MRWFSHVAIAGSICAVFNPALVPAACIGAVAPDALEMVQSRFGRRVKHRGSTHYLAAWVIVTLFAWFVYDYVNIIYWVGIGAITHWFTDALNSSGVPVGPWSDRRVHIGGGRLKFGSPTEYLIVFVVVVVCAFAVHSRSSSRGFLPYFYQWGKYYEKGIISGAEWRANRWNIL